MEGRQKSVAQPACRLAWQGDMQLHGLPRDELSFLPSRADEADPLRFSRPRKFSKGEDGGVAKDDEGSTPQ